MHLFALPRVYKREEAANDTVSPFWSSPTSVPYLLPLRQDSGLVPHSLFAPHVSKHTLTSHSLLPIARTSSPPTSPLPTTSHLPSPLLSSPSSLHFSSSTRIVSLLLNSTIDSEWWIKSLLFSSSREGVWVGGVKKGGGGREMALVSTVSSLIMVVLPLHFFVLFSSLSHSTFNLSHSSTYSNLSSNLPFNPSYFSHLECAFSHTFLIGSCLRVNIEHELSPVPIPLSSTVILS